MASAAVRARSWSANRGPGAMPGQLLGSVPGNVVRRAAFDVLVVQTSALDDSLVGEQRITTSR